MCLDEMQVPGRVFILFSYLYRNHIEMCSLYTDKCNFNKIMKKKKILF